MITSSGWWTQTRYAANEKIYDKLNKQDGVINVEEELNLEIRNKDCNGNGFGGYINSALN